MIILGTDYRLNISYANLSVSKTVEGLHKGYVVNWRLPSLLTKSVVQGFGYSIGLLPLVLFASWVF